MWLTNVVDTVKTGVLNIPIFVRMTFCPPRHKLQTLCIGTSDREESFFGIPVSHLFLREFNNRKTRSSRGQRCLALRIHSHHDRLYKILLMMHSRQSIGTAKHIISFVLRSLTFKWIRTCNLILYSQVNLKSLAFTIIPAAIFHFMMDHNWSLYLTLSKMWLLIWFSSPCNCSNTNRLVVSSRCWEVSRASRCNWLLGMTYKLNYTWFVSRIKPWS